MSVKNLYPFPPKPMTRKQVRTERKTISSKIEKYKKNMDGQMTNLLHLRILCTHPKTREHRLTGKECLDCGKTFWPALIENE